jgi:hypothetical protein
MLVLARARATVAGPRCDAIVGRRTLGSRPAFARQCVATAQIEPALNLAAPHWLLARSGDLDRPDLRTGFAPTNTSELRCYGDTTGTKSVGTTNEAVNGLTTIAGHTVGLMGELTLKIGRWAEQGRRTDERLDQLVDLFERHLRDDHDRPPS